MNLIGWLKREAAATKGVPQTTDPTAESNQAARSASWNAQVVRPHGQQSLLIPAWYRGVSLIMRTMGMMSVQYQVKNRVGENFMEAACFIDRRTGRLCDAGRLNYLMQVRPNPLMTASVMQEQIEFKKIYHGNALVYIERDEFGWPSALWLCNSGSYNLVTHDYTVSYQDMGGWQMRTAVPMGDILHFKNVYLSDDFTMGIPTLTYAFKALSIAATANEQALQDVAKGGRHKVLLQEEKTPVMGTRGRASRNEMKSMRDQFSEEWAANDVVLLDNVADAKIISQTSQQLQLLEQRSFQVTDLARILGIPRIMMMEEQGSNYKMPEHATQEFLLRTISPIIREHEDEYNSKLLEMEDFGLRRIHVCESALRRLDPKGQAEIDKLHLEAGWSVNELRKQYDLPSIEDGDAHYVSTNLAEVGSEKLRSNGGAATPSQQSGQGDKKKKKGE